MSLRTRSPATRAARAGVGADQHHHAVIPPIHLSSTFAFAGLGDEPRYDYTRSGNPTRDLLAEAIAELEEGCGGVVTATGMAAVTVALHLVPAGGRVVLPSDCYGGTHRLMHALSARGTFRLDTIDPWREGELEAALSTPADLLWIETPSNPLLRITDLRLAVELGGRAGATVVVDNTFLSPALQRPLTWGADIVVHSTTKYLNGHSDMVGGALVARDPALLEEAAWWANALGVTGAPFDSYLTLRGLRTLHARIRSHLESAEAVAEVLVTHPAVARVFWPGLATHPGADVASRQQDGPGAVLSFELKDGVDGARRFVDGLTCFSLAESLGGVESLVCHPATMTHAAMPSEAQVRAGITDGLLRMSIGIEAPKDLASDVGRALDGVAASAPHPRPPKRRIEVGEPDVVDDHLAGVHSVEHEPDLDQTLKVQPR